MNNNDNKLISNSHIGGAKRKNGHKLDCKCHICDNIKNKAKRGGYEEDMKKNQLKRMGGSKKKNGHKPDCSCPICNNMKKHNKQKGASLYNSEDSDDDSSSSSSSSDDEYYSGGKKNKKRGNGHKKSCGYPICKNIRNKKGGEEPDIENQKVDEQGGIKVDNNMLEVTQNEIPADTQEYDELDLADRGEIGKISGGTRKKKILKKNKTRKSVRGRKTKRHYKKKSK